MDKSKHLLSVLADGAFHSGTELAQSLGVSRSCIWQHINALTTQGVAVLAVTGKGYRLEHGVELLSAEHIYAQLTDYTRQHISLLEIFSQIDSTNRYLVDLPSHEITTGRVCLAEMQTAGKGRRGRQWVSPFGSNIYLSLSWQFNQGYASTQGLSLAVGVAVIRVLRTYGIKNVGLKWPNDIFYAGKKLGGILIEIAGEAEGPCRVVIGLGLNVLLAQHDAKPITQAWTDLTSICRDKVIKRNCLVAELLAQLIAVLTEFQHSGLAPFITEWSAYDCLKDQAVSLFIGERAWSGTVRGINANGLLLLEHDDGKVQAYASGEVSFASG